MNSRAQTTQPLELSTRGQIITSQLDMAPDELILAGDIDKIRTTYLERDDLAICSVRARKVSVAHNLASRRKNVRLYFVEEIRRAIVENRLEMVDYYLRRRSYKRQMEIMSIIMPTFCSTNSRTAIKWILSSYPELGVDLYSLQKAAKQLSESLLLQLFERCTDRNKKIWKAVTREVAKRRMLEAVDYAIRFAHLSLFDLAVKCWNKRRIASLVGYIKSSQRFDTRPGLLDSLVLHAVRTEDFSLILRCYLEGASNLEEAIDLALSLNKCYEFTHYIENLLLAGIN